MNSIFKMYRAYVPSHEDEKFISTLDCVKVDGENRIDRIDPGPTYSVYDLALSEEELVIFKLVLPRTQFIFIKD